MQVDGKTLRELHGISDGTLKKWRDEGLPSKKAGNKFVYESDELLQWLIKTKRVVPQDDVANTQDACARTFGVSVRTIGYWAQEVGFPGVCGSTKKGIKGRYPLLEIAQWIRENGKQATIPEYLEQQLPKPKSGEDTYKVRLGKSRAEREELRLRKEQGQFIDAALYQRECQRQHSYVVTILNGLPAKVIANLRSLNETQRKRIFKICKETIEECCEQIAELIEGDADEKFSAKTIRTRRKRD